jgi:hypothetical protein
MFRRDVDDEKPSDFMLRKAGFKLKDRPKDREPVWTRDGHDFAESEAWHVLNNEAVKGKR